MCEPGGCEPGARFRHVFRRFKIDAPIKQDHLQAFFLEQFLPFRRFKSGEWKQERKWLAEPVTPFEKCLFEAERRIGNDAIPFDAWLPAQKIMGRLVNNVAGNYCVFAIDEFMDQILFSRRRFPDRPIFAQIWIERF